MVKATIRDVKKALAAAFPEVEFTYGTAGRGREAGNCVSWQGGPSKNTVRGAVSDIVGSYALSRVCPHVLRGDTVEEAQAYEAEYEARCAREQAEREADLPRRLAEAAAKRAATKARNKLISNKLRAAFPGVAFKVGGFGHPEWVDGPTTDEVEALLGLKTGDLWTCRSESYEARLARYAAQEAEARRKEEAEQASRDASRLGRTARRLLASQERAEAVALALGRQDRRMASLDPWTCSSAQMTLPFADAPVALATSVAVPVRWAFAKRHLPSWMTGRIRRDLGADPGRFRG